MTAQTEQRPIAIVSACMRADGLPTFALTEVVATPEEIENGAHYYIAEAELLQRGYDEPYVHFDSSESPPFLHDAVRQFLNLTPAADEPIFHSLSKES